MEMQNNKRCNGLTHARLYFSQSEKSLLQRVGEGGGITIFVTTTGGKQQNKSDTIIERKIDYSSIITHSQDGIKNLVNLVVWVGGRGGL